MEEKKSIKISLATFFLIIAIILIVVMAYFTYKFYNDKKVATEKVSTLNNQISNLEKEINILKEDNAITTSSNSEENVNVEKQTNNSSTTSNNNNAESKYKELTEDAYKKLSNNEYFIIQSVNQSDNGKITLKGRIYEDVELGSISKDEYNSLKSSGKITLFGEEFTLGEYEAYIPGYSLKNSNGYGFYVTDSCELVDFNDTNFVKGTDKYYTVTLNSNVKLESPDGTEETLTASSIQTMSDNEYINTQNIYTLNFSNGSVSKVIYGI